MNRQKLNQLLENGLMAEGHSSLENGAVWETFEVDDVVIQAPATGRENDLPKNNFLYRHLAENGVNVPEVILSEEATPSYGVYENVDGDSLSSVKESVSEEEYGDVVETAGKLLGQIHSTEGFGYGWPDQNQGFRGASHSNWREFVSDRRNSIQEKVDEWPFNQVVDRAANHVEIEEIPLETDSAVLHRDYHGENLIFGDDEVYVIDLDNAVYGDPRFDFVYSSSQITGGDQELEERFLEGYESVRDLEMDETLEDNYVALSVLQSAEAGYWNQQNDSDLDMKSWVEGLHKWMDFQYD